MKRLSLLVLIVALLAGCAKKTENRQATKITTYPLRGEVIKTMPREQSIMIAHEEIPNFMKAMIMPFKVKDTTFLSMVQPGDSVLATLAVSQTESWLSTISVIGKGTAPESQTGNETLLKKLFKQGEPIPDFEFTNQDNKKVHLADFKGKIIVLTFVYTRCPLPDFCIRMTDNFTKIQQSLKKDAALDGKWHLLTISFDPDFDKPSILKNYGKTYGADFSDWDFLTTDKKTLEEIGDGFDLTYERDQGGLFAHTLRTALIDKKGDLISVLRGNDWVAADVANRIRALANK